MSQETMTPEIALGNLITVYKQSRLTPEEHDIMKVSIQTLIDLINRDKEMKATQEAKTSKKG